MKSITDSGNTQRSRILGLLICARGSWVPLPEILALGIAQYNARIFELRRLGFSIQSYQEGARSFFRLVGGPGMPVLIAAAYQQTLFGDLTVTHVDDG